MPERPQDRLLGDDVALRLYQRRRGGNAIQNQRGGPLFFREFSGWESIQIERSIDAVSGTFEVTGPIPVLGVAPQAAQATPRRGVRGAGAPASEAVPQESPRFAIEPGDYLELVSKSPRPTPPALRGTSLGGTGFRQARLLQGFEDNRHEAPHALPETVFPGFDVFAAGYVDQISGAVARSSSMRISGRDLAADLVDCSIRASVAEVRNASALDIVHSIAAGYGVLVTFEDGGEAPSRALKPIERFTLQPAESCFSAIERVARLQKLIVYSDPRGFLVLSVPGRALAFGGADRGGIVREGLNVEDFAFRWSYAARHSKYLVQAQRPGSDDVAGEQLAIVRGEADDLELAESRPRLLKVQATKEMSPSEATDHALWQASVRASRGSELEVTVQGWRHANGPAFSEGAARRLPWQIGEVVQVDLDSINLSARMLVGSTSFHVSQRGRFCTLGLLPRDAYSGAASIRRESNPFSRFVGP